MSSGVEKPYFEVDPYQYVIYSFTPSEEDPIDDFYKRSFEKKLEIVSAAILKTETLKKPDSETEKAVTKILFLGPENLFSQSYGSGPFCTHANYYSQEEKNRFKETMLEISKIYNGIIIPGTIRWWSQKSADSPKVYRNNAYLFFKGTVQHYNKHVPHPNFDYPHDPKRTFWNRIPKGDVAVFKTKNNEHEFQSPIFTVDGIKIGIEICADITERILYQSVKKVSDQAMPNIHLLISDGVGHKAAEFLCDTELKIHNMLIVHVERRLAVDRENNKAMAIEWVRDKKFSEEITTTAFHYNCSKVDGDDSFYEVEKTTLALNQK